MATRCHGFNTFCIFTVFVFRHRARRCDFDNTKYKYVLQLKNPEIFKFVSTILQPNYFGDLYLFNETVNVIKCANKTETKKR